MLKEGYTAVPHYGLLLAKSMHLPAGVLEEATRIANLLDVQVQYFIHRHQDTAFFLRCRNLS